jgi:TetR/AcrR family transcriptional regulator, transcriptional repressor for nem operon
MGVFVAKSIKSMARNKAFEQDTVLEKAMNTFWKKGFHDTSMQDLVDAMGINRASMYDTFGDKHQLYLKSLESYREINRCAISKAIENEPSPKEKIRKILRLLADESLADTENKGCFFTNATLEMLPHDTAVNTIVCDNFKAMNQMLETVLSQAQAEGEIAKYLSAKSLADFVQCNIGGIRVIGKTRPTAQQLYDVIENVMRVL